MGLAWVRCNEPAPVFSICSLSNLYKTLDEILVVKWLVAVRVYQGESYLEFTSVKADIFVEGVLNQVGIDGGVMPVQQMTQLHQAEQEKYCE